MLESLRMSPVQAIAANLAQIRERVARAAARSGRRADEITIVAVSKTFPADAIRIAFDAGLRHFGENRVQEFESKQTALAGLSGAAWHLIGHLQSNKARRAVHLFDRIDSVDSISLARKLDASAKEEQRTIRILIEVHLGGEETKSGVAPSGLWELATEIMLCPHLLLNGLMTIPPYYDEPSAARPFFAELRELRNDLARKLGVSLPILSMGMSHDFETAIEEGATEIRIGTALFGSRPTKE